jgi:hypothetical protein
LNRGAASNFPRKPAPVMVTTSARLPELLAQFDVGDENAAASEPGDTTRLAFDE